MIYKTKALLVFIIIFSLLIGQSIFISVSSAKSIKKIELADSKTSESYDGYIVKLKKSVSLKGYSLKNVNKKESLVRVSKEEANQLKNEGKVDFKEPNYIRRISLTPNDPYFGEQYGLEKLSAISGWDIEDGTSNNVIVAVIDTGVDISHPDLSSKIVQGYDFANKDSNPQDDQGHGTHVAGIIAADTNNGKGVSGVSWGAKIMPVKVLGSDGSGNDFDIAKGIIYAADNGAKVINLSIGGPWYSSTLADAVYYAYSKGVIVVAAAGNDGDNTINYPAGYDNVIGVAATDQNDKRASFSNYNSTVDVSAPGVEILSTYYDGSHSYAYMSGTSMATPHAAGFAAVLLSNNPNLSPDNVENQMKTRSDDLGVAGRDNYYGYGRLNLNYALNDKISLLYASAPSKANYGQKIVIKGSMYPKLPGQLIKVRKKKLGSSWSSPVNVITDANGLFNYTDKLVTSVQYSFSFSGTADIAGSTKRIEVSVKPKVSLNSDRKTIKKGRSVTVSGFVYPVRKVKKINLYIYKSGKRMVKSVLLGRSRNGKAKFKLLWNPSEKGIYRIRARFENRSYESSNSNLVKLRVK